MTQKPYKCRVEYLESIDTQWIDTGISMENISKIECIIDWTNHHTTRRDIVGGGASSSYSFEVSDSGYYGLGYNNWSNVQPQPKDKLTWSWGGQNTYPKLYINESLVCTDTLLRIPSGTFKTAITSGYVPYCKFYNIKIYNFDNVLVRDMIPVLDNSGRPAMYDQVSGQLFYNQGTGEFTYGRQIIPVEYLESTGTQYIDTGIIPTSTTETKMGVEILSIPSTFACFGGTDIPNNSQATYAILRKETNASNFNFRTNYNNAIYCSLDTNKKYDIIMNEYGSRNLIVNGDLIGTFTDAVSVDIPIYLFARNSNGTAQTQYSLDTRLYYFSIKDSTGKLVRDYIPCIDENGVGYMFDLVTNTCYLNAGTGQFKVGPYQADNFNKKLLRKKLALMLATLKKKRKYYCELEYLEGTGTQYIDTGLDYFADFEIGIQLRTNVSNKALGNGGYYCMQRQNSATPTWQFTSGSSNFYNSTTPITEHHVMKWKDNKVYSDDTFLTNFAKGSNIPHRMYLYTTGTNNKYPNVIYFCKLWNPDNGVLVRDFIPVLDWNMTPCMYDRVTEQLFYNQGTGTFTYGREIHYVDYLEADGTQYIDTGYLANSNTKIDIDFTLNSHENSVLFGGRTTAEYDSFFVWAEVSVLNCCRFDYTYRIANNRNGALVQLDTKSNIVKDKEKNYLNGIQYQSNSVQTFQTANNAYLFAGNNGGTANYFHKGKIFSAKIYDDDNLIRNYLPAIDENGVGFMFDRVSHSCFLNAGTGVFKYPAREVEYINFGGAQYIQTAFNTTEAEYYKYEVKFDLSSSVTNSEARVISNEGTGSGKYFDIYYVTSSNKLICRPPASGISLTSEKAAVFKYDSSVGKIQGYYEDDPSTLIYDSNATFTAPTININYKIGSRGNNDSSQYLWQGKIYYVYFERDGLTCNFVSAFKDGVAGLLDKTNNVFYTNAGTGTFGVGKIVEPEYE